MVKLGMTHLWHDIELTTDFLEFQAVIEIPKNSKVKYEIDKEKGVLCVDRILYSSVHYPSNYGFLPQTLADDDDALDVLILAQEAFVPMSVCKIRPIGVLALKDQGKLDDKIIAVCIGDPEFNQYQDLSELPKHRIKEFQNFFEEYKKLEKK